MAGAGKSNLQLVQACDNYFYEEDTANAYYKLLLPHGDRPHGYILPGIFKKIPWTSDFRINHETRNFELQDASDGGEYLGRLRCSLC
ncbi:putative Nudix hydrolase domain-containing protein [Seiridium cardinale]